MANTKEKLRLGDLLIQHQLITAEQLQKAIQEQHTHGGKLGAVLIQLNIIDENTLLSFLSKQLDIPFIDLKHYKINPTIIRQLPETYARRFRAIVLEANPQECLIGMVDPQDLFAYDELAQILKRPLQIAIVRESELLNTIDMFYRRTEDISEFAEELSEEMTPEGIDIADLGKELGMTDAPVVKLLQSLFEDAVQVRASDIHIEPDENLLRIRQRIDGVLHESVLKETHIAPALTQRLKLMANLNIAERRVPQDGRFSVKVKNRIIDVRLSTMPIQYGESVVMRLLDRGAVALKMDQLGMSETFQKKLQHLIALPNGMLLVTGPTGSGKTTTLYSLLSELNQPQSKIITVEDPVEYRLPRISQVQVNAYVELDFARVLRAALRQDPDILMVGEIRDEETADIALRAAMTGHFVLATMHTNDSVSSIIRLLDMEKAGYLVAAALRAAISQRLLRRNCESCLHAYEPTPQERAWLHTLLGNGDTPSFKQSKGCHHCNNTGYKGRVGIYELLEIDDTMADALRKNDTSAFTKQAEKVLGHQTLVGSALDLATKGVTSLHEVMRVVSQAEDTLTRGPRGK